MKIKIPTTVEEDVKYVRIVVPVNYEEEEIPNDFPGRKGDVWTATVEIDTGKLIDWPLGKTADIHLTVKDSGSYSLINTDGKEVAKLEYYVPNFVVPGKYGDTIELKITTDGNISNWPRRPDVREFLDKHEDQT